MRESTLFLFFTSLIAAGLPAAANTAYTYSRNELELYEIVVKDEGAGTTAEPGIYFLSPDTGEASMVVRGQVVGANRAFKGILAYGEAKASRTAAHNALTVIDGDLVVFNRFSNPKYANTQVVVGDPVRGIEVTDAVQGLPVRLPKIESMADLTVRSGHFLPASQFLQNGGQLIIASMRAPSFIGDGLTFAFILEHTPSGKPHVVGHRATLISHSFMSKEALDRLVLPKAPQTLNSGQVMVDSNVYLYAPNVVSKFKTQISRRSNSPVVKAWVEHITRFEEFLERGFPNTKLGQPELALGTPLYNVFTGQESLPYSPIETITEDGTNVIGQIFNHQSSDFGIIQTPLDDLRSVPIGKGVMRFIETAKAEAKQIAHLPIDRDPATGKHRILAEDENEDWGMGRSFMLFSSGSAYLMARPSHTGASKPFVTVAIRNPVFKPKDKIHFVRMPMTVNGHAGSAVIVWRRSNSFVDSTGRSEERTNVYALTVDEDDGMAIVNHQTIYAGVAPLTFEETRERIVVDNGAILFDSVTPVRGAKRYRALEEGKTGEAGGRFRTTPYEEVSRESNKPGKQRWLRTLLNHVVVQDLLHYREFNQEGANNEVTGLYLVNGDEAKKAPDPFLMGVPLHGYTGKPDDHPSYVLHSKSLIQPWGPRSSAPNVLMTMIPYDPAGEPKALRKGEGRRKKGEEESVKFKMAVMLSPDRLGSHGGAFGPWLRTLLVDRPYRSLQSVQVIQGTKNRAHEVSILFFFSANAAIPESRDEVMIASFDLHWNGNLVGDPFTAQVTGMDTLHRGLVIPSSVHPHLQVDAEGSYYWITDPATDRHSSQYKVVKLTTPGTSIHSRAGFSHLREPDEIRETDFGHTNGKRPVGGRWEILTPHALSDAVANLREQSDKRLARENRKRRNEAKRPDESTSPDARQLPSLGDGLAEQQLLSNFERTLDQLATLGPTQLRRPRVFVVDKDLKEKFKWSLYTKLALDGSAFSIQNNRFRFFHANASLDDVEVSEELAYLRESTAEKARILYVDQEQLHAAAVLKARSYGGPDDEEPGHDENNPFPLDDASARSNMLVLLASGGKAKSMKGFHALKEPAPPVPMISIVTPEEWGDINRQQATEAQGGVLDNFNVDYNFLTTPWTMWPPRTDRAAEDVKQLTKRPYRAEEMRVFPTLERLLNQAAAGELKGKKTLILVPEELKNLVQTLVLARWSTQDASAGDWNYKNPKLAFHRVINSASMKNQSAVLDNFSAMRGAANSRNSVLYSDLETLSKIRRADQDASTGRGIFRLRDPVQAGGETLFGEFDKSAPKVTETASEADLHEAAIDEEEIPEDIDGVDLEDINPSRVQSEIASVQRSILSLNNDLDRTVPDGDPAHDMATSLLKEALEKACARRASLIVLSKRLEEAHAGLDAEEREGATASRDVAPHLMWWIASEGELVQPRPEPGWRLSKSIDPKITGIFVGTPEDLEKIEVDMAAESKYFNIREEFDVLSLEAPSEQIRYRLVEQLFERPEVQSLHLEYELKRANGRDPRSQLIYHFINRVDQLAYDQKLGQTTAFIRAYVALKSELVSDELFRNRRVSEDFIERLFTKVFPMPLNREILPPSDPLNRLANQDQAVRDLQSAGVEGSQDLKRTIFNTIFSQTRPTDSSRLIPNSQILFGRTSTGKTYFLRRMFHMLDMKEYSTTRANNEDADYIFINVSKLVSEENPVNPDFTSVSEMINNISDLLSQPKGARASIVFDDYHSAANKEVREKLYQFLRGLFEAPGGMYIARAKGGGNAKAVEIPVQNLNLYMTVNPNFMESARRNYIKPGLTGREALKREVLAAISGDNFHAEESFLARWGDIIDMDRFPRSAKVPELVKRVRLNQSASGKMVLVDPDVITQLIDTYPEAHARELLQPAASALTDFPINVEEGPIYLISNNKSGSVQRESFEGSVSQQDLTKAVRKFTQIETIKPGDPVALEHFMGFIMHNFRLQIYNSVALEASQNDLLVLSRAKVKNVVKTNFLLGVASHVIDNPRLPVGELGMRPDQLGFYGRTQREELMRYHNAQRPVGAKSFFPIEFDVRERAGSETLDSFLSGRGGGFVEGRKRRDVLAETVTRLESVLGRALQLYLRLATPQELFQIGGWGEEQIATWFQQLPEDEPEREIEVIRAEIVNLFKDFEQRINGVDITDVVQMEFYSQARLFAYAMDKAITRLPWAHVANFSLNVAAQSNDSSLGSKTSYRNYVGKQQLSAFALGTPEFMSDMLDTAMNENTHRRTVTELNRMKSNFREVCEGLLTATEGAAR